MAFVQRRIRSGNFAPRRRGIQAALAVTLAGALILIGTFVYIGLSNI